MSSAFQATYGDYVTDADGHAVAGAAVALYPTSVFPPGSLPTTAPPAPVTPTATALSDATGRFLFTGLPPDDYHVLVQYTPPGAPLGAAPAMAWRYGVPVAPYEAARRTAAHAAGAAIPRTLSKLLGGLPVSVMCVGEAVTLGYDATGTVAGGWVARLAARLAAAVPAAGVTRYDPTAYATTFDAPIPSWSAVTVGAGAGPAPRQVSVIDAAVSGDTVLRVLRRVTNLTAASWAPPPDCYVVLLGYGEMDADPGVNVTAADFAAHLTGLVDVLRAGGAEALLCTPHVCPPPGDDSYAAAVRAVAALTGCGLVDLRALWQDHYDPAAPNDGYGAWLDTSAGNHVHPTDAGHRAIGDEVYQAFDPAAALPLPYVGDGGAPHWECVRLLNSSALLTYSGDWTAHTGFALSTLLASPREMQAATPGDRVTFSARCSELYMLCRRWRDGGQVTVTVDGVVAGTVDLYRALPLGTFDLIDVNGAIAPRDRVPLALGLADAVHTVTLTLAATANPASQGTLWRFDALELARPRVDGLAVEGTEPLQQAQRGAATVALVNAAMGAATVTFPRPYAGAPPVVVAQSPNPAYYTVVGAVSATSVTITLVQYAHTPVTDTQTVPWLAFG